MDSRLHSPFFAAGQRHGREAMQQAWLSACSETPMSCHKRLPFYRMAFDEKTSPLGPTECGQAAPTAMLGAVGGLRSPDPLLTKQPLFQAELQQHECVRQCQETDAIKMCADCRDIISFTAVDSFIPDAFQHSTLGACVQKGEKPRRSTAEAWNR